MRKERLERLESESDILGASLENVEKQIAILKGGAEDEKEIWHLSRLLYAGKIIEKVGLLYSFNEQTLCQFLAANKIKLQKPPE